MIIRTHPEHNYRGIHVGGNTFRIALDPSKPITRLTYPEFYDVKITSHCGGACSYCYQSSTASARHVTGIADRFERFFGGLEKKNMPFQIAFGGGEPTGHPEFCEVLRRCNGLGITPNYTTNGMWALDENTASTVLGMTSSYCGGVAVSTHPHIQWRRAVRILTERGVFTNLHCIIGDRSSIDEFARIYDEFHGSVRYFVLLPLSATGRSLSQFTDWAYLTSKINGSPADIAFGANFHRHLTGDIGRFSVSLYEPESLSAYLDLETGLVTESSFSTIERIIPGCSID